MMFANVIKQVKEEKFKKVSPEYAKNNDIMLLGLLLRVS